MNSAGRSPGNRGPSSFFSRRAHLLTTASAQTPYPSPRRKRQVSSIPLCLLFPQSQRLCGSPFAAVVCLAASCALRGGFRFLRKATDNATALESATVIVCAVGEMPLCPVPPFLQPPAQTCHRQLCRRDGRCERTVHFLFCERETKKGNEVNERWLGETVSLQGRQKEGVYDAVCRRCAGACPG